MQLNYKLTAHAKIVIKERGITLDWLELALISPEKVEVDIQDKRLSHHLKSTPEYNGRVLRVVVNLSIRPVRIVTAYFDRSMRDKL